MKILPLARDPWLLDSYINASGHIRLGTLFMDLDALAGVVAYKHTGDSVMTVTAAVDRITLKRPLSEICDLELSGRVTFATGRSSMEISLQVAKAPKEGERTKEEDILLTCAFTMVPLPLSQKSRLRLIRRNRYHSTQAPKNQSSFLPSHQLQKKRKVSSTKERKTITSKKQPPNSP